MAESELQAEPVERGGLLAGLTEPQRRAVMHTEGPLLVLAAAGSGKTRVITRRAAWLVLECGIPPWQVLSITFTNKAAGEMRQRVEGLVSAKQARALTIGTFHALCAKLLRRYAEPAGIGPDFAIHDAADQKRAMKQAFKDLDLSSGHFTPEAVLGAISNAKNQLIDAERYAAEAADFFSRGVAKLYRKYTEILRRSNALDFDDLLLTTARLLRRDQGVRAELQERYPYIQIDEYQDTNHAQFVIAHTLADAQRNLCVVGDPDQSIYGWRGADLRNILDFKRHYPDATVIELGQNYRSTPQILELADTLIRRNRRRIHKPLFTQNPPGARPRLLLAADEEQEAERVVRFLREQREAGVAWGRMAVMYRINALSRVIEEQLLRHSIPYIVARGTAFYQRKEVKDALAYMRVIASPGDEVALLRIINTPARGIGEATVEHLRAMAAARGLTLDEAIGRAAAGGAGGAGPGPGARAAAAIGRFAKMLHRWRAKVGGADAAELGFEPGVRDVVEMVIRDSGLERFYQDEKTGDEQKLANLYELVSAAQRFDEEYREEGATLHRKLLDYLESVALVADVDAIDPAAGAVTLLTLHAAKGLEFDAVAIIGLEEGLLPHKRSMDDPAKLEEERRLCFVGITRAQRRLQLSHARYRTVRGLRERTIGSQFLRDFGRDLVEVEDISEQAAGPWGASYGGAFDEEDEAGADIEAELGFGVGSLVRHPRFGVGRVTALTPAHRPTRAKVRFASAGLKTLVLQYARLELVEG